MRTDETGTRLLHVGRREWSCLACAVAYLLFPDRLHAQTLFGLTRREGFLEFGYSRANERTATRGLREILGEQRRFDERLGLAGNFFLFDPTLLTVNAGSTFGFFQENPLVDGLESPGRGRLLGYDFTGTILPEKDYTTTIFANRGHSVMTREFAGISDVLSEGRGATLALKSFLLPSTFAFRQEDLNEESRFGSFIGRREEYRKTATYDGHNNWDAHDVSIRYEFTDLEDRVLPQLSYSSHSGAASHRYHFGQQSANALTSSLRYFRREGAFNLVSLGADEGLSIQHSKSFSTGYHYNLSQFSGSGSESSSQTGVVSMQHRLYESLFTDVNVRATRVTITGGGQNIYGGRLNSDYHKTLGRHGRLLASLGATYDIENDRLQLREIPVFQERHTARLGLPFRLDQLRVIPESILITGERGTLFQQGFDYVIRATGELVEIQPLISGRIQEGESLAVDYRVRTSPAIKFSTASRRFSIRPDFGWLQPYYAYERVRQGLLAGIDEGFLENLRAHTVGVQLHWTRERFNAFATQEYRTQESRLLPYRAVQFSQAISFLPRQTLIVGFNFDEALFHFRSPSRKTVTAVGRASVGWKPWTSLSIEGFSSVRLWRDTLALNEVFDESGVRVLWSSGKFTVTFTSDLDRRRRNLTQAEEFRLFVTVLRRF